MITLQVTSDSSLPDLRLARILLDELTARAEVNMFEEAKEFKASHKTDITVKVDASDVQKAINEAVEEFKVPPKSEFIGTSVVFNAAELAEAETLGKPVCSTVDAAASTTAHADIQVNTSIPTPQSVFGRPAQTAANVVNPVAPVTECHAIDADGLTWDARIHSSSRELNKDGTWRKRRGVNTDLVTQVEAELRSRLNIELGIDKPTAPAIPKPPVDHSHEGETPVFTATIPTDMTFPELLDGVTKAMVAGQLTQARITEALKSIGIEALPHLLGNPALIPAFREALGGVV